MVRVHTLTQILVSLIYSKKDSKCPTQCNRPLSFEFTIILFFVPLKFCISIVFNFSWDLRQIENNAYAIFCKDKKEYYGLISYRKTISGQCRWLRSLNSCGQKTLLTVRYYIVRDDCQLKTRSVKVTKLPTLCPYGCQSADI